MALENAKYTLDEPSPVEMRTLLGEAVTVTVTAIDTRPDRVEIAGTVSWDDWEHVVEVGAFHLDLAPDDLGGAGDREVELVLVMRPGLVSMLDDADALIDELFRTPDVLQQTEAWLLGSAMQQVGGRDGAASGAVGFRTEWAGPLVD